MNFKKVYCITIMAAAFMPAANAASEVPTDAVKATDIDIARTDDNLFLKMNLDLSGYDGMNRNREVTVTPMLVNGADTLRLPAVTVAGHARYYHWLRLNRDEWPAPALYKAKRGLVKPYEASTTYRPWMAKAQVVLSARSCGCCGEPIAAVGVPVLKLDMEPKRTAVMFPPSFAFIEPKAEIVKHREIKGSAYIDFPVNRTELYPDYRRNPAELARIRATIDSVRLDKDVEFKSMTIKGYASPEGSYANNVRLAKGRTATLKDYVLSQYTFPANIISASYEPEDWAGLRRYVENSSIENREAILSIIDSDMMPDPKNDALRKRFPVQYEFLLREVYPGLRHSDYTVEYNVRNYTDIGEIKRLLFSEAFMTAVRLFPDSPEANLNAANIEMRQGRLEKAGAYLLKAGDSPEATYARGVCEGLKGNYNGAKALLQKAYGLGVKQAGAAIDALIAIEGGAVQEMP